MEPDAIIEQLEDYCTRFSLEHVRVSDLTAQKIAVPWAIDGLAFPFIIKVEGAWVVLAAAIARTTEIPRPVRPDLYREMLLARRASPELSFELDDLGNVGTTAEFHSSLLAGPAGFSLFKIALMSIQKSILVFKDEIAARLEIQLRGFPEQVSVLQVLCQ